MKPIEILLLVTFGVWVGILYIAFTMLLTEDLFELIWIPIGLMAITFLYILRMENTRES